MTDDQTPDDQPEDILEIDPRTASAYSEEDIRLAQADEREATLEATMGHLQNRVIQLNLEVRVRDRRIVELERELAKLHQADPGHGGPAEDPEADA